MCPVVYRHVRIDTGGVFGIRGLGLDVAVSGVDVVTRKCTTHADWWAYSSNVL